MPRPSGGGSGGGARTGAGPTTTAAALALLLLVAAAGCGGARAQGDTEAVILTPSRTRSSSKTPGSTPVWSPLASRSGSRTASRSPTASPPPSATRTRYPRPEPENPELPDPDTLDPSPLPVASPVPPAPAPLPTRPKMHWYAGATAGRYPSSWTCDDAVPNGTLLPPPPAVSPLPGAVLDRWAPRHVLSPRPGEIIVLGLVPFGAPGDSPGRAPRGDVLYSASSGTDWHCLGRLDALVNRAGATAWVVRRSAAPPPAVGGPPIALRGVCLAGGRPMGTVPPTNGTPPTGAKYYVAPALREVWCTSLTTTDTARLPTLAWWLAAPLPVALVGAAHLDVRPYNFPAGAEPLHALVGGWRSDGGAGLLQPRYGSVSYDPTAGPATTGGAGHYLSPTDWRVVNVSSDTSPALVRQLQRTGALAAFAPSVGLALFGGGTVDMGLSTDALDRRLRQSQVRSKDGARGGGAGGRSRRLLLESTPPSQVSPLEEVDALTGMPLATSEAVLSAHLLNVLPALALSWGSVPGASGMLISVNSSASKFTMPEHRPSRAERGYSLSLVPQGLAGNWTAGSSDSPNASDTLLFLAGERAAAVVVSRTTVAGADGPTGQAPPVRQLGVRYHPLTNMQYNISERPTETLFAPGLMLALPQWDDPRYPHVLLADDGRGGSTELGVRPGIGDSDPHGMIFRGTLIPCAAPPVPCTANRYPAQCLDDPWDAPCASCNVNCGVPTSWGGTTCERVEHPSCKLQCEPCPPNHVELLPCGWGGAPNVTHSLCVINTGMLLTPDSAPTRGPGPVPSANPSPTASNGGGSSGGGPDPPPDGTLDGSGQETMEVGTVADAVFGGRLALSTARRAVTAAVTGVEVLATAALLAWLLLPALLPTAARCFARVKATVAAGRWRHHHRGGGAIRGGGSGDGGASAGIAAPTNAGSLGGGDAAVVTTNALASPKAAAALAAARVASPAAAPSDGLVHAISAGGGSAAATSAAALAAFSLAERRLAAMAVLRASAMVIAFTLVLVLMSAAHGHAGDAEAAGATITIIALTLLAPALTVAALVTAARTLPQLRLRATLTRALLAPPAPRVVGWLVLAVGTTLHPRLLLGALSQRPAPPAGAPPGAPVSQAAVTAAAQRRLLGRALTGATALALTLQAGRLMVVLYRCTRTNASTPSALQSGATAAAAVALVALVLVVALVTDAAIALLRTGRGGDEAATFGGAGVSDGRVTASGKGLTGARFGAKGASGTAADDGATDWYGSAKGGAGGAVPVFHLAAASGAATSAAGAGFGILGGAGMLAPPAVHTAASRASSSATLSADGSAPSSSPPSSTSALGNGGGSGGSSAGGGGGSGGGGGGGGNPLSLLGDLWWRAVTPEGKRLASMRLFFRLHPQLLPAAVGAVTSDPLPPAWTALLHALEQREGASTVSVAIAALGLQLAQSFAASGGAGDAGVDAGGMDGVVDDEDGDAEGGSDDGGASGAGSLVSGAGSMLHGAGGSGAGMGMDDDMPVGAAAAFVGRGRGDDALARGGGLSSSRRLSAADGDVPVLEPR
jgi:hypothetical protein